MVSDILSESSTDILTCLNHPSTRDCYQGELRERIIDLVKEMDSIRRVLDTPIPINPYEIEI